jgi:hypothetical protein
MLGLLQALDGERPLSQRSLAAELGIALGLVNAYLKRCINKGLVKVGEAPARRYAYYLTPLGFAEKSRLTVEYLSSSFGFFRQAKGDCSNLLRSAQSRGFKRILLAGRSDLSEIAALCAPEYDIDIVGLVDAASSDRRFMQLPVFASISAATAFDAVLITDLVATRETWEDAVARVGDKRVLVPEMLRHVTASQEVQS